jgi:uncharacterized protein YutE (UPF0331/DUF86 family)
MYETRGGERWLTLTGWISCSLCSADACEFLDQPTTYAEVFRVLVKEGVLDAESIIQN